MSNMFSLALVPLIVFIGLIGYLMTVDRKIARLERAEEEQDDL